MLLVAAFPWQWLECFSSFKGELACACHCMALIMSPKYAESSSLSFGSLDQADFALRGMLVVALFFYCVLVVQSGGQTVIQICRHVRSGHATKSRAFATAMRRRL